MTLAVGERLAERWEVRKVLRGGQGEVYILYDHQDRLTLAAKTPRDDAARKEVAAKRFLQEARTWIQLDDHPNIVRAYFVETIGAKPYLFLEFVPAGTLADWIGAESMTLERAIDFSIQFCRGMEHAYTRGMKVHRDIKPQNCLMSRDGTLKISDFGLVRIYEQDAPGAGGGLTRVGSVLGTPMYLAPEQFLNSSGVDARADIYSAGVMFYEMLCGRTPFVADPRDAKKWFQLHLYTPAPPLAGELTAKSPLRPQLETVIHRCLTKTPEQRYATFAELRQDFEKVYRALTGRNLPEPKVAELLGAADLCNKAFSLGELGRTQEEAVILEQVLNTDPQDPDDWIQRGAILARLGDAESAQVCFAQASLVHRVAPGRKVAGKPRKAMTLPTRFFGSDAGQVGALHSIARLFVELNRAPEALPYLDQVLGTDPGNVDVLLTQAEALSKLGRFKESLLALQKAIKLDNNRAEAWLKAGMTLIALKQTDGARDALEKSLRLAESSEGWFHLGGIYLAAEKYTHAIKCYDQAQALDPKNSAVWSHKGLTMAKSGRFDDALMCFTEADRLGDPKAAEAIARMQALLADQELDAKVVQE